MKKIFKLGLLLFGISIFSVSCQKEEVSINNEQQGAKTIHRMSIADFNSKIVKNDNYDNLQNYFDTNSLTQIGNQNKIEQGDDVLIQTDEVLLIQTDSIDYYTFKLITDNTDDTFYNLIINVNNQNEITNSTIFEYNPSDNWLLDTTQAYSGFVSVTNNDVINLNDLFNTRSGDECVIGNIGTWTCSEGNNHAPDNPNCTQATSWDYVVTPIYAPCDEFSSNDYYIAGDEENADGGGPTNGGGNSNSNNDNVNNDDNVVSTIPTMNEYDYMTPIINCINGLGQTDGITIELCVLENMSDFDLKTANQYLQANNCSPDAQQNIIDSIHVINDLNTVFGAGNYEINCESTDDLLNFDNANDFNDYINSFLNNSFSVTDTTVEVGTEGTIRQDDIPLEFSGFPQATFLTTVRADIPDDNNALECLNIISASTTIVGDTSLLNWNQTNDSDPNNSNGVLVTINEQYNYLSVKIRGEMIFNSKIAGISVESTKVVEINISYNYSTSSINYDYCYWYYIL